MKVQKHISEYLQSAFRKYLLSSGSVHQLESDFKGDSKAYPELSESVSIDDSKNINFLPEANPLKGPVYETPNIFTLKLNDVYFCPKYNILHTQSRQILEESISTQKELDQFNITDFYFKEVEKISSPCSLFRSHKNGYYHTLIDNIPRLSLLHDSNFRNIEEIKILLSHEPTKVEKFYLDKLLPKNAKLVLLNQDRLYHLEDLIFPSFLSRRFSGYLPSDYINWFINKVAPKRERKRKNRIFISRIPTHKGRQRCILNEDDLFQGLKSYGFKRYVLDHMTIEEQITLFYDAEAVVAAHGAGLANTVFSERIKVLELFPSSFVLPHYYFMAKSLDHEYKYSCAQENGKSCNFNVDVKKTLNIINKMELTFKDKGSLC